MPRRLFIFLVLAAFCATGLARPNRTPPEHLDSLVTYGTDGGQFLAIVERAPKSDGTFLPVSVVWYRPLGGGPDSWTKYAEFDARVLALAERGGDLAVLLELAESGPDRTQIRYVYNSREPGSRAVDVGGTALPPGVTPTDIAGGAGGGPLLALGTQDGRSAVWALAGTQWQSLPPLPDAVAELGTGALDLASVARRAVVAARTGDGQVLVLEQAQDRWQTRARIELAPGESRFMAISGIGDAAPMLYLFGESDRIVQLPRADATTTQPATTQPATTRENQAPAPRSAAVDFNPPANLGVILAADDARTAAIALGSVRVLRSSKASADGDDEQTILLELALDPATLHPAGSGGAVALSFSSITAELREQMITLVLYALLVVAVIAVLRQRPLPPADRLRTVAQQLAPLPVRFLAGSIDGLPILLAAVAWWLAGDRLGNAGQWILAISALLVYFGHMTAAEALTGRSLGKALFALKVVRTDGTDAGPGQILLRNILRPLDVPTAGLGLAWLNPLRQRLGDIAAGTIVIRTRREPAKPLPPAR